MNYKPFENWEDFVKDIFETIDLRRTVILLNQPDHKFKETRKSKNVKNFLIENLHFILPDACYQPHSDIKFSFTRIEPKTIGMINDFAFIGLNVYSLLCAPVYCILYFDENGNPCYYVPMSGNTYNLITDRPFGFDTESDEKACQGLCRCSIEDLSKNPQKYQDLTLMTQDIKSLFGLTEYSMLNEFSVKEEVTNLFEFTKHNKTIKEELL